MKQINTNIVNNYATKSLYLTLGSLVTITLLSGVLLSSSIVSADNDSVTDQVEITVPTSCTMSGTGQTSHTATIDPGTYSAASGSEYANGIGKTTITALCNDYNGFSIYAIGFTNSEEGNNTLKGTSSSGNATIATKAYEQSDTTSNWSMKLTKVTDTTVSYNPNNMTITTGYDNYHSVPDDYTKVVEYKASTGSSATDQTLGAKLETTYAAFISTTQPADTYTGQVKYVMVHPYNATAPESPPKPQPSTVGAITYYANVSDAVGTMGIQALEKAKDWSICTCGTDYSSYCMGEYDDMADMCPTINIDDLPELDYYDPPTLFASNYSRNGYGFAGWSDSFDYLTNSNAHFYGPNETISLTSEMESNGLSLYAVWIKSTGTLQDSSRVSTLCGTGQGSLTQVSASGIARLSSVAALTDERDNQTYAIAKLADGNCWIIENLRLENTANHNSDGSLAQGYGSSTVYGNFVGLADPEDYSFDRYHFYSNSLYSNDGSNNTVNIGTSNDPTSRMPRYNNINLQQRAVNPTSPEANLFSYGNYYTWHAAIADTAYYGGGDHGSTSICPRGWRIPQGNTTTAGFGKLDVSMGGNGMGQFTVEASNRWRRFPVNFLFAGNYYGGYREFSGSFGDYWSSTSSGSDAYYLQLDNSNVYPGNYDYKNTYYGHTVRCTLAGS